MLDLFKYFMSKPLEALVACLCIGFITMQLGLFEVKRVQATQLEKQIFNDFINKEVLSLSVMMGRVDENVKSLKKNQELEIARLRVLATQNKEKINHEN